MLVIVNTVIIIVNTVIIIVKTHLETGEEFTNDELVFSIVNHHIDAVKDRLIIRLNCERIGTLREDLEEHRIRDEVEAGERRTRDGEMERQRWRRRREAKGGEGLKGEG